jgi:hypothetical protein
LALAWVMYADENEGDLVNGMLGINRTDPADASIIWEQAWVGPIPLDGNGNPTLDNRQQEGRIKQGALWEYAKNPKVFRCPAGQVGHMVSYAVVDAMNGVAQTNAQADQVWANNRGDISRTQNRIVFVDIGKVRDSSYHVYYHQGLWHDPPSVRHRDGMTVSYADAHSLYIKWKSIPETVTWGRNDKRGDPDRQPTTDEGRLDLQQFQREVYGTLGYTP